MRRHWATLRRMSKPVPSVAYLVRHVHHYREPFYLGLSETMKSRGVEFDLLYGQPGTHDQGKNDATTPEWALFRKNRILDIRGQELIYQPWFRELFTRDLVIVEQASRLLINYLLIARRALGRGPRIAMVGHGSNLASNPSRFGEALKRGYTGRLDWFFAYTDGAKQRLVDSGFPAARITAFQNTLDMSALKADLASITEADISKFRAENKMDREHLVLSLGSLYPDKRPDLMVAIGDKLNAANARSNVLVVGSGPDQDMIAGAANQRPWMTYKAAAFGREKALALAASDVLLVPGVAGLVVLDSFAAGLPLMSAHMKHHPPETEYVRPDVNGLMLAEGATAEDFALALDGVLESPERLQEIARAASASGDVLTIDNMIRNFADGIGQVLGASELATLDVR